MGLGVGARVGVSLAPLLRLCSPPPSCATVRGLGEIDGEIDGEVDEAPTGEVPGRCPLGTGAGTGTDTDTESSSRGGCISAASRCISGLSLAAGVEKLWIEKRLSPLSRLSGAEGEASQGAAACAAASGTASVGVALSASAASIPPSAPLGRRFDRFGGGVDLAEALPAAASNAEGLFGFEGLLDRELGRSGEDEASEAAALTWLGLGL